MQRFSIQSIFLKIFFEDGGRVFKTASASRSLPKEKDKKEATFEIESIDEESDKEEEEEEEEEEEKKTKNGREKMMVKRKITRDPVA